ncbi:MAG: alpha/beta hydrolase [Parvibaculales bacterium]
MKVDPELLPTLEIFKAMLGDGMDLDNNLAEAREMVNAMGDQAVEHLVLADHVMREIIPFQSSDGADLSLRIICPKQSDTPMPILYFIHGGGFVVGEANQGDASVRDFAEHLGCFTASVEYRLSPEHAYPVPLRDCYEGLQYLIDHAGELNLDPDRIIIHGVSAGGGLAAGLALWLRDHTDIKPRAQLLIYPMLDDTNLEQPGDGVEDTLIWSRANNLTGWRAYLGDAFGSDEVDIYAAPARAKDLSNLPPAHIPVGDLDLFLAENTAYAKQLQADGVDCDLQIYEGAFHGFDSNSPEAAITKLCKDNVMAFVKRQLSG